MDNMINHTVFLDILIGVLTGALLFTSVVFGLLSGRLIFQWFADATWRKWRMETSMDIPREEVEYQKNDGPSYSEIKEMNLISEAHYQKSIDGKDDLIDTITMRDYRFSTPLISKVPIFGE